MQAGALERRGLIGEKHAVGGEREIADARVRSQHLYQAVEVLAKERLAAGEPHAVDAEVGEDSDEARQFFKGEQFLARQPDVILFRHAVDAAQIAAVGDRDAQAAASGRPSKSRKGSCGVGVGIVSLFKVYLRRLFQLSY